MDGALAATMGIMSIRLVFARPVEQSATTANHTKANASAATTKATLSCQMALVHHANLAAGFALEVVFVQVAITDWDLLMVSALTVENIAMLVVI